MYVPVVDESFKIKLSRREPMELTEGLERLNQGPNNLVERGNGRQARVRLGSEQALNVQLQALMKYCFAHRNTSLNNDC